ncbi:MAG: Rieske (2Fe-2S) protein [Thermoanaerobaculia bacterium]
MNDQPNASGPSDRQSSDESSRSSRRRFLNWFLGTSVGALLVAAAYPVVRYLSPPRVPESTTQSVDAGATNDAKLLADGFEIVRFGSEPVIVLRLSDTDVRAFSAVCTHLGCIVSFRKEKQVIWCYCHNGVYDLNGKNIAGPPPRPLTPYHVEMQRKNPSAPGEIIVSKA